MFYLTNDKCDLIIFNKNKMTNHLSNLCYKLIKSCEIVHFVYNNDTVFTKP